MGTAKTDTPSDTGLNLPAANFPPLSPLKQKNPGITNTEPPLAEPPAVPRIPEGTDAQANTSSQQDTSNKPPEKQTNRCTLPAKKPNQQWKVHNRRTKTSTQTPWQQRSQTMHVKDTPNLQVDLTSHTYSALWQRVYPRPKKHWNVRGLTMQEMIKVTNKLVKVVAKHQRWKGPYAGRELSSDTWRHCINDCLAREEDTVQVLGEQKLDQTLGYIVRMAKTDPHVLENQKPTNRGSNTVNLDPDDVVNVAYHAINGMTGNVWKETDHLLEESKGGMATQSNSSRVNASANSRATAAQPKNNANAPHTFHPTEEPPHKPKSKQDMWK